MRSLFIVFLLAATAIASPAPRTPTQKMAALEAYRSARSAYEARATPPARGALLKKLADPTAEATAHRLYGDEAPRVLSALRKLGPGYDHLAYHPGLVTHLAQFKKFLGEHPQAGTPQQALAAFSRHLGTRTVYRALALDDQAAARIDQRGIEANFARHDMDEQAFVPAPAFLGRPATNGGFTMPLDETIQARVLGFSMPDHPLLSVSTNRDIAVAAASPYLGNGKSLHVYQAKVPALDLVHTGGPRSLVPGKLAKQTLEITKANGTVVRRSLTSAATESFVLYRIDPKEIVAKDLVAADHASTYAIKPR